MSPSLSSWEEDRPLRLLPWRGGGEGAASGCQREVLFALQVAVLGRNPEGLRYGARVGGLSSPLVTQCSESWECFLTPGVCGSRAQPGDPGSLGRGGHRAASPGTRDETFPAELPVRRWEWTFTPIAGVPACGAPPLAPAPKRDSSPRLGWGGGGGGAPLGRGLWGQSQASFVVKSQFGWTWSLT